LAYERVVTPPRINLMIGIPTAGSVPINFSASLTNMMCGLALNRLPSFPEHELQMTLVPLIGSTIHRGREMLADRALATPDTTHLLFLDDDMEFQPQVVDKLFSRREPIVVTNYMTKEFPPRWTAVDLNWERVATTAETEGLQPIVFSGFGVSLFEVEVFRKIPKPWFMPAWVDHLSDYTTEDMPFYDRARQMGYTVHLDHDASKMIGHVGRHVWKWDMKL